MSIRCKLLGWHDYQDVEEADSGELFHEMEFGGKCPAVFKSHRILKKRACLRCGCVEDQIADFREQFERSKKQEAERLRQAKEIVRLSETA